MKKINAFRLLGGVALSAMTLAPAAFAQDATAGGGMAGGGMSGGMAGDNSSMSSGMMSMTPQQVTGTVQRYYVDRSGYVTAMDVQTANGTQMVRFSPGMGQRLYSTYPVGGQASVYAVGSQMKGMEPGMMQMDVVGMGETMPAAGMMMPMMVSDVDMLQADPFIMIGSKLTQFRGTLKDVVTDDNGEVLALVLRTMSPMMGGMMKGDMMKGDAAMPAMDTTAKMDGDMAMKGGMGMGMMGMGGDVLVRVPRESRQVNVGTMGSDRVAPLFKGALVEVVGYNEAPRYGVLSAYGQRVAANTLVINGRAVGAVGIPMMTPASTKTLFSANIGGSSKEEQSAMKMGYMTYDPNGTMMNSGAGNSGSMDSSTTTTGGATGGGM